MPGVRTNQTNKKSLRGIHVPTPSILIKKVFFEDITVHNTNTYVQSTLRNIDILTLLVQYFVHCALDVGITYSRYHKARNRLRVQKGGRGWERKEFFSMWAICSCHPSACCTENASQQEAFITTRSKNPDHWIF